MKFRRGKELFYILEGRSVKRGETKNFNNGWGDQDFLKKLNGGTYLGGRCEMRASRTH